ncbi:MAG: ATP-grasp domain-containing protein, partial [Sneathiella sp.]|nr:ATP-grasp domain-containing protein [Sneathiella sp.]
MSIQRLLIANRGEIALRISRAARSLGISCVAVYPEDDRGALHAKNITEGMLLPGAGPAAYLNGEEVIAAAKRAGADAIHPGYGFLSENAEFAALCEVEGLKFVGPTVSTLRALADKSAARALAIKTAVPVLAGTNEATSVDDAKKFLSELSADSHMFIKALAGGGGRGMRLVTDPGEVDAAYASARAEAEAAFGDGRLYVERFMPNARHIEVQIIGDGKDVIHLHERDCSLQRRNQKVLEIAPAPNLSKNVKQSLCEAAVRMAQAAGYCGLGTFEFLVSAVDDSYAFMEANPRIQVEHTITEEILGLDLVVAQLQIASGKKLEELGYVQSAMHIRGYAVQAR